MRKLASLEKKFSKNLEFQNKIYIFASKKVSNTKLNT
jgi:hypothetical protein